MQYQQALCGNSLFDPLVVFVVRFSSIFKRSSMSRSAEISWYQFPEEYHRTTPAVTDPIDYRNREGHGRTLVAEERLA